jgi:hypothetical protein
MPALVSVRGGRLLARNQPVLLKALDGVSDLSLCELGDTSEGLAAVVPELTGPFASVLQDPAQHRSF